MKTKFLATVALTTLLGTGLYASCNQHGQGMMQKNQNKQACQSMMKKSGDKKCQMMGKKNTHKMHKKAYHHMKKGERGVMGVFKKLNLTTEQKTKIADIKKEIMAKKRTGIEVAFTKEGFDKAKYIEVMKQKREYMLESRAQMLEKTYAILTPKQKEQFKVLLDLQAERKAAMMGKMKKRGMKLDKNCNGRG